ncbi:Exodeoxyribonuclease 7 small subunit [BD1-7 clade bacterium]|uniref:Exodeoxyribonuclease 7 small subunit n=1 Tax=BD1-7 clade bacterium TaxID=2029982 RepID=A0A5S9MR57_9GAMM|nr:Exodeoxyribonuclease 7 small subunit [BD1-7 clade bacterium]CAA0085524.1 Exodeoxyribonuclease 7 small subunit [BD1-7 clade bacterium]CAA0114204.1 Exodeoxyribonuclease 7 small subunit [BD1-7 clade bacterium]
MPRKKAPAFEQSLQELETIVQQMERGDLELEQSLAAFEKGISLIRECQTTLDAAEQRVQQLTATAQGLQLTELDDDELS